MDGLGKKPDPPYVHVVKRVPAEEAMIAVRAVQTLPKVQDVYRCMGPNRAVRRSSTLSSGPTKTEKSRL